MSSTFPTQTSTYTGVCSCKATKYTATIRNLSGDICSCSFCRKTDFLYIHTAEDFKYERQGPLTTYRFATGELGYEVSERSGQVRKLAKHSVIIADEMFNTCKT